MAEKNQLAWDKLTSLSAYVYAVVTSEALVAGLSKLVVSKSVRKTNVFSVKCNSNLLKHMPILCALIKYAQKIAIYTYLMHAGIGAELPCNSEGAALFTSWWV